MSAQPLWFLDNLARVLVPHERGADGLSIIELSGRRADSPPLHVHTTEDEAFYVLEGELTIRLGDEERRAGPGDALLAPRGVPHTYRVDSDAARWLAITPAGDFDAFVRQLARPAAYDGLPQQDGPPSPEAQAELAAVAAAHGIELVGPPLAA